MASLRTLMYRFFGGGASGEFGFYEAAEAAGVEADDLLVSRAPVQAKPAAAMTLPDTDFSFTDTDTSGTAAARTYDLVLPGFEVGDWVTVHAAFFASPASLGTVFTFATIVAGAKVNHMGSTVLGIPGSGVEAATSRYVDFQYTYQTVAGDLEADGSLRLRLQHSADGTAGSISGPNSGGFEILLEAFGPLR